MTHYVTFTPDPDQDPDDKTVGELVFECDEPETAACRWTSDCDCEGWNVEHDDKGAFHISLYETDENGRGIRHEMYLDPGGCLYKWCWHDYAEENFREWIDADWPLRPGRHEVTVTFSDDYIEVEYAEEAW